MNRAARRLRIKRLQDVLLFVESHISDPNLSIATVAKGCGISPRYLSALLKRHKTSYAKLVWDKRLKIASEWLSQSNAGEVAIREIAYRVGFKSPEHFSRRFKRAYNMSPCDYRAASVLGKANGSLQRPCRRCDRFAVTSQSDVSFASYTTARLVRA